MCVAEIWAGEGLLSAGNCELQTAASRFTRNWLQNLPINKQRLENIFKHQIKLNSVL